MVEVLANNHSRHPVYNAVDWRYKARAAALALLGYAVIFGLLGCLIAILGGALALIYFNGASIFLLLKSKFFLVLVPAIWLLCQALWIRFDKPAGHQISRADYPLFFAELDALRNELRTPRIHQKTDFIPIFSVVSALGQAATR